VSFDESKAVFHCHGAGCDFSGSYATLARELGLTRRPSAAEYHELRENRERANRAARDLYERVRARRFELLEHVRGLGQVELSAHQAGPDHHATWGALAFVYRERPAVLAELAILENWLAVDLLSFLAMSPPQRRGAINAVLEYGGVQYGPGHFLELG
jgi:hypothetical protein